MAWVLWLLNLLPWESFEATVLGEESEMQWKSCGEEMGAQDPERWRQLECAGHGSGKKRVAQEEDSGDLQRLPPE